ncbi:MAG: hypothetical protein FWH17_03610 [Oscillospiraceae bacterium]|nr:hypothetical protein [Oscillospiraceae bacterium]
MFKRKRFLEIIISAILVIAMTFTVIPLFAVAEPDTLVPCGVNTASGKVLVFRMTGSYTVAW